MQGHREPHTCTAGCTQWTAGCSTCSTCSTANTATPAALARAASPACSSVCCSPCRTGLPAACRLQHLVVHALAACTACSMQLRATSCKPTGAAAAHASEQCCGRTYACAGSVPNAARCWHEQKVCTPCCCAAPVHFSSRRTTAHRASKHGTVILEASQGTRKDSRAPGCPVQSHNCNPYQSYRTPNSHMQRLQAPPAWPAWPRRPRCQHHIIDGRAAARSSSRCVDPAC